MARRETNRAPKPPKDLPGTLAEALSRIDLTEQWREAVAGLETAGRPHFGYGTRVDDDGGFALGRYQMRRPALRDAGMMDGDRWTGKYGVASADDFLDNPAAQEAALKDFMDKNDGYVRRRGHDKRIGNTIVSDRGPLVLSHGRLAAAIHNQGIGAVSDYLRWVEGNGWDSRGKIQDIEDEKRRTAFLGIEERLSRFPDVPYRR